jgi:hypothetical protein
VTAVESSTKVVLGGTRGGPPVATLRQDRWWLQPVITVSVLTAFVIYSTWAAFQNRYYYVGADVHRNLISPLYSPCLSNNCVPGSKAGFAFSGWSLSPALLILIFPLGFRLTCYYYRRSYYRRRARSVTPTARTRARPVSRSSCRTCTATSSTPGSSSTSC